MHLPKGDSVPGVSPSVSTTSLSTLTLMAESRDTHSVEDVVEKLQHESNVFTQADYLNYLFNAK